jgi:hypothetical protein
LRSHKHAITIQTEVREIGDMDLLKDIRQGLRGETETRGNEGGRASGGSRRDRSRRSSTGSSEADEDDEGTSEPSAGEGPGGTETVESGDRSREDGHLCSFCEAEFDASRGVCPECNAEIVFRGER